MPVWSEEGPPEVAVVIPEVDIADNVRRMLETARQERDEAVPEQPVTAPAVPPAAVVPAAPVSPPSPPAAPETARPAPPPPSGHVPLPAREITIRSLDDIRELARELDEAKQRQRRQE